jgi:transmembrane sensor
LSDSVLDEATAWFVEFDEGEVSTAAREDFVHWLRASPEHVRAYLQISARWEALSALRRPPGRSVDELIARALAEDNVVSLAAQRADTPPLSAAVATHESRPHRRAYASPAIAASVLLLAIGAFLWLPRWLNTYSTAVGEQRSVTLPDGSVVELNSRSRVIVTFSEGSRNLELSRGQALFQVARDPSRPFVVKSGNTRVRAVGTRFDVYKKESGTVVTVVEGHVAVVAGSDPSASRRIEALAASEPEAASVGQDVRRASGAARAETGAIYLHAGEQLTITGADVKRPPNPDIAVATAWTQKRIVFQSTPLTEVVEEFNRYNTRRLVITDASIADIRISGVFSSTDPASLLRGLRSLGAFTIHEDADRIEISPH